MLNKTINGYTIKRKLGEGGMAEVWYAENGIGNPASIKFLKKKFCEDETVVERFRNEAMVMVKLKHPNIRQVYDYVTVDGLPCIIMEYLEGRDMKAIVRERKQIDSATAIHYWNEIASALANTHAKGVIHRDIKPSNIFVTEDGHVKLLDFGIAKVRDSVSGTQTGQKLGTLVYMSPEQITDAKHVDYRTDLYSLAVTFVHLLSGRIPYDTDSSSDFAIMTQIVQEPLSLTGIPSEWRAFLEPYLAKKPEDRPELREFLGKAKAMSGGDGDNTLVEPKNPSKSKESPEPVKPPKNVPTKEDSLKPASKPRKRLPWIIGGAVVLVIVAVALGIFLKEPKVEIAISKSNGDCSITVGDIKYTMKKVEGGTFQMGSDDSDAGYDDKPVHTVTVSNFYMGETEVTQALWKELKWRNPSFFKGRNLPVEKVSWKDCQKFIRKLNRLTGKKFRLPTEAEWEYAARGGNKSMGFEYAGSNIIDDVAWYNSTSNRSGTKPVKTKQPNELGLYDMSGNVREWCEDWKGDYSRSSQKNPTGPYSGRCRVCRGGNWGSETTNCRVSYRNDYEPKSSDEGIGFRLALVCE